LKEVGVHEQIILKSILKQQGLRMWTRFQWKECYGVSNLTR